MDAGVVRPAPASIWLRLQRIEELQQPAALARSQAAEVARDLISLSAVAQYRIHAREAQAVVHQAGARAQAPERDGPHLIARALAAVLHDAVARADVMQQEIAERVDRLVAERF